jgi:hypothetical protein
MSATEPQPSGRSRLANVLVIIAIIVLVPALVYGGVTLLFGPPLLFRPALPDVPPPDAAEMVEIPFTEGTATSEGVYAGTLRLVLEGFGQAHGTAFSDAFYLYTAADGFSLDEPEPLTFTVNGEPIAEPPEYNTFHVYEIFVTVDAGPMTFTVDAPTPDDNNGRVRVYIVP